MGQSKRSLKRLIHNITDLTQEISKTKKKSKFIPKGTRKRTTSKAQSEQKEENNKDQSGNK